MHDTLRWMTAGVAGTGRRSSGWVSMAHVLQDQVLIASLFSGSLLEANLIKAAEMALTQRKVAEDFATTFPNKTVQKWRRMVKEWHANPSLANPYVSNERGMFFRTCLVIVSYDRFPSVETF